MAALQRLPVGPNPADGAKRAGFAMPRGWIIVSLALVAWVAVIGLGVLLGTAISAIF